MPIDPNTTVTISFAGLALFCINPEKNNRCEVQIIGCDRHKPTLDVQRISVDSRGIPEHATLIEDHQLNWEDDLLIKVMDPVSRDSNTGSYQGPDFDRLAGSGDANDFRWVVDLEGPDFHNQGLVKKRLGVDTPTSPLSPKIYISDAVLYTETKTGEAFARVPVNGGGAERSAPIGNVAFRIGANLYAQAGEIVLWNKGDETQAKALRLEKQERVRYHITIENLCSEPNEDADSDFAVFYNAVEVPLENQYDIRRIIENGDPSAGRRLADPYSGFSWASDPRIICIAAFLSKTTTIATESFDL